MDRPPDRRWARDRRTAPPGYPVDLSSETGGSCSRQTCPLVAYGRRDFAGGDESQTPVFMAMAGLDESRYIKDDIYTSEFWNSTFIGKLMPFTRVGYTSFVDGNSTNLSQDYKPGAYSVYSKDIKYPKSIGGGMTNEPLSLVYSSDSFDDMLVTWFLQY